MLTDTIQIKYFIENDWSQYADYDNKRSLPHIMDGLKITQRKAIYTALKLPKNVSIKVSQFASKAAECTAYHHGESSMISAIVGLAQDYPGSNNFPLLEKQGQFGSRLAKESAAPRYIHAKLHSNWDLLFNKDEQAIVEYQYDDGEQIEPKYFIPIVPTLLLNGSDGTGNGFKSYILPYNIKDIVKSCKEILIHGKVKTKLIPHIKNWIGKIEKIDKQVVFTGIAKIINPTKIEILELPPNYDNEKYKKILNKLIDDGIIKDYKNKSTEDEWRWIIECPRSTTLLSEEEFNKKFGLVEKSTETIVVWGIDNRVPLTFNSPEELIEYWYKERIKLYQKSINHQIKTCKDNILKFNLKMEFIKWCLKNDFRKLNKKEFIENSMNGVKGLSKENAENFISIPMYRITTDEVVKLENEMNDLIDELEIIEKLTPEILMEKNLKSI